MPQVYLSDEMCMAHGAVTLQFFKFSKFFAHKFIAANFATFVIFAHKPLQNKVQTKPYSSFATAPNELLKLHDLFRNEQKTITPIAN